MKDKESTFICLILTLAVVIVASLAIDYVSDKDYVPERIRTFCQAKHDVYGDSFDECLSNYRAHQK